MEEGAKGPGLEGLEGQEGRNCISARHACGYIALLPSSEAEGVTVM